MSGKWTLASNTTAGDRLGYVYGAAVQLSDGSLVQLVRDPAVADPNGIYLTVVPAPAHTTPAVIATLRTGFGMDFDGTQIGTVGNILALAVDDADNIAVFGLSQNHVNAFVYGLIEYQAFTKGAGLTWTAQPASYCTTSMSVSGGGSPIGVAALWCDTGGGTNAAGHFMLITNSNSGSSACYILDAGKVLQGVSQPGSVTTNPTFLANAASLAGTNLDLEPDGFGATHGFALVANGSGLPSYGSWGVTAAGILTTGPVFLSASLTGGTLSIFTKVRVIRYAPNRFALIYPSVNPGLLTIACLSGTTGVLSTVDTNNVSNFPTPSASQAWDAMASDPSMATVWIFGWSSATPTTMLRRPITFPGDVATLGAVVTDDTSVGSGAGNTSIRTVKQPVDLTHADWQTYDVVSPYGLIGDFSSIPVNPSLPQLVSPPNNSAAALATVGGTFDWTFLSPLFGDAQASYALRFQASGSTFQWWNGTALQGSEIYVTSAVTAATLPAAILAASTSYSWSVSVKGVDGTASGYCTPWIVTSLAIPTTPTLTVAYNSTTNVVTLTAQGTTASAAHGSIEYSDDAGVTWQFVRNADDFTIYPGPATFTDLEVDLAITTRQYRARAWAPAPLNYSAYQTANLTTPTTSSYWVFDPIGGTGVAVLIKAGSESTARHANATIHDPVGSDVSVPVADVIHARDYAVTWTTTNLTDQAALDAMIDLQRPLWYQSPIEPGRWLYCTSCTTTPTPVADAPWITYYEHAATFVAIGRPAP